MKNIIFKLRDSIRRWLGKKIFDKAPSKVTNTPSRIVFVRWDAKIGDSYMFSFMYREIKKHFQHIEVIVITANDAYSMHKSMDGIDLLIPIRKRPKYSEIKKTIKKINNADIIIHMTENMKLKDLYLLSKLNPSIVYSLDDDLKIVNKKMSVTTKNLLFKDKLKYILADLGIKNPNTSMQIKITSQSYKLKNKIIINPFGSNDGKTICREKTKEIIKEITTKTKEEVYLLNSPKTKSIAEEIVYGLSNAKVIENIDTIQDAINVISDCALIISVDTSIVHIAHDLDKKLIAIYPKKENEPFNIWEPHINSKTKIIYSSCSGINPNLNNFDINDIIQAIDDINKDN